MLSLRGCTFSTLSPPLPITALSMTTNTSALLRTKRARFEVPASTSKQPLCWDDLPSQIITTINQLNAEATTTPQLHNQGSHACVCLITSRVVHTTHRLTYTLTVTQNPVVAMGDRGVSARVWHALSQVVQENDDS
uniref:Uncharacterized protein n=1 Tax=Amphilophus citrinellus TaxID=61819 RepID=A0A3Q0QP26_AMPCI